MQINSHAYDRAGQLIASVQSSGSSGSTSAAQAGPSNQLRPVSTATPEKQESKDSKESKESKESQVAKEPKEQQVWRYAYNGQQQRILAQDASNQSQMQEGTQRPASAETNANGQPTTSSNSKDQRYSWDALGRLTSIQSQTNQSQTSQTTHYLYSQDKQILAEVNPEGKIDRQYIWLADMLLAVIDTNPTKPTQPLSKPELPAPDNRALEAYLNQNISLLQDVGALLTSWGTVIANLTGEPANTISFIHSNHLGAPELATNAEGQVIWQAGYAPFGQAKVAKVMRASFAKSADAKTDSTATSFTLNIRLPGQYFDQESGLHYNRQRYYDPAQGQYLTPDPLGTPDGPNAYAYAANNPLTNIDPDGLILFAFDGTGNSNPPPGVDDFSNVYKFFQGYDDAKNGQKWYMNGVGRNDADSGINGNSTDPLNGNTGRARVNYMLAQFDNYALDTLKAKPKEKINIDIVGFSRGAAMARDFSNRVATWLGQNRYGVDQTKCVEIRFMGLWDTVAQFGLNGFDNTDWQLAIPAQAKNVFQAVALNENRYLFPGESIDRGTQRGFIGSHADIGGSYGTGDLSDVALNWITDQAKLSGVTMFDWGDNGTNRAWATVSNPVVHDKSNGTEDSAFCDRVNNGRSTNCSSRRTASPGGLTATIVTDKKFIIARDKPAMDADGNSKITGDVNMKEYALWLKQNYNFDIAVGP